jgi:alpha-L-rhamnosidase
LSEKDENMGIKVKFLSKIVLSQAIVFVLFFSGCESAMSKMGFKSSHLAAKNLRCEYRTEPLGIDITQPRLSWIVTSSERNQRQTGYQLLVASTRENLASHKGDLWDSGKVDSDNTTSVVYEGKPLVSNQDCFWKVRVWDKDGKLSGWSEPDHWSMGLLHPGDWKARWIGFDTPTEAVTEPQEMKGLFWIWSSDSDTAEQVESGKRFFRKNFVIPDLSKVASAQCFIAGGDNFRIFVNGDFAGFKGAGSNIQETQFFEHLVQGTNVFAVEVNNKKSPGGLIAKVEIVLQDGSTIAFSTDESWLWSSKETKTWKEITPPKDIWAQARLVGQFGCQPWGHMQLSRLIISPANYLRKNFAIDKPIKKARLYSTALGIYQMYLNGQAVSDEFFNPGWTDYNKRVYYRTYDVTKLLNQGSNAIGAVLADGWYAGYLGYTLQRGHYGSKLRLLSQLEVEYADGTQETIVSDDSWKASHGPLLEADFLMGETYDARKELPGWNTSEFDDKKWAEVAVGPELQPQVQAAVNPPVRIIQTFEPVSITEPRTGVYVFDLGQNFAGVAQLKVMGKAGQKIQLWYGERLKADGSVYTENMRNARAIDTYICKGIGTEQWQGQFSFHGFQYVQIMGLAEKPGKDTITGLALSSDTPIAGTFECSDPMINKLHSNIYWTQRMNFIDIPTDCPQRDERLGWTGDAQVYIRTATLNTDVHTFFTKWLQDLVDGQRADGQFPCVAPVKVAGDDGGPAWADAGVICPWTIYQVYGDKELLERQYPSMVKFIDFCRNRSTAELLPPENYHCFGDWLNIKDNTPNEVIYTAYFALSTKLTANAAAVLGKTEDAKKYNALFDGIKQAFNKNYVQADGKIKGDTQTAYVLAIAVDLVEGEKYDAAAKRLVELIENRDWHLSTGFIGTKDLMLVLSKIGRNDVAYRLLRNDTFPSWGFSVKHGATSIWERWNGWTPEDGFNDPEMNSFAHYSFGAVYQWMVENIGGIRLVKPGYKEIVIKPSITDQLTWAKTSYDSIHGTIAVNWERKGQEITLNVSVPANVKATVYIPGKEEPVEVGSGFYTFKSKVITTVPLTSE